MATMMDGGNIKQLRDMECRLAVVGRSGSGKSSVVNTILGARLCKVGLSAQSTTGITKLYRRSRFGKEVEIVDTPGLFDSRPDMTNKVVLERLAETAALLAPGPHAILMTLALGQKYAYEEKTVVTQLRKFFGEDAIKHTIIVFTRGDELKRNKTDITQYVESAPPDLKSLLTDVGHRYIVFDNVTSTDKAREASAKAVLDLVEKMARHNTSSFYSSDLFRRAEEEMRRCDREIHKDIMNVGSTESFESLQTRLNSLPDVELQTELKNIIKAEQGLDKETSVKEMQKGAGKNKLSLAWIVTYVLRMVSRRRVAEGKNRTVIENLVMSPALVSLIPLLPAPAEEG